MQILKIVLGSLLFGSAQNIKAQEISTNPVHKAGLEESKKAVDQHKKELAAGVDTRLPWQKLKGYEQHKFLSRIKGSHKVEIHPVTQVSGITTGLVIAYGHVIAGPYVLEDIDEKLIINGVQVKPSVLVEKIRRDKFEKHRTESASAQKISKIRNDVQEYYKSHVLISPKTTVKNTILAMINNSTDVFKNPEWKSDDSIEVELSDSGLKYRIVLSESELNYQNSVFKNLTKERLKKNREGFVNFYKKALESGGTLVFLSADYEVGGENVREKVVPIMKEKGLTREQRIEKMHSVSIDYGFAEDIVDNYIPNEWERH